MPYQRSSVHSNGYSTDGRQSDAGGAPSGDSAPTYVMEHLATFTVAKETGIVYPADGMRRLLQLEKSNGIWSQKMQLRLDQNWVLIMDYETGAIMERFPVALIQEPTAFTSHDPMEIYNNILVFIVGEERSSSSRSEMHIFQCQSISAQELVEDLKLLRVGKAPLARRTRHIPPPPPTPPPEPPLNGVSVRDQVNVFNAASHQADARNNDIIGGSGSRDPGTLSLNDETSSTSSEKYERDVTILNHCFDDIEKFIARLQHAAAASRELERRRKNRKSKKKDMGDGMLTMRAKPPPELEFVDIFQKFKLSFNLLAKLKSHIHDPNAPELVHFLFTPLALIVDASHDTHYGPNLPAKVVSPLLTREAVNLLINCVTSKETELWHSLGDAWLVPRDQWKGYVAPYHPVFMDGWSPEFPVLDDRDHPVPSSETKRTRAAQHQDVDYGRDSEPQYGSDYFDYELQEALPSEPSRYYNRDRPERYSRDERERSQSPVSSDRDYPSGPPLPLRDVTARSDISADSIERNGSGPGGPTMSSGPGGPPGPDSQQRFERAQQRWLQDLKAQGAKVVQVTYPRTANNDKELTVIRGEYLEILDDSRKWWKARNSRGQVAHVPHTIVTPPPTESIDVINNPVYIPPRGYDRMDRDASSPAPGPGPAPSDWLPKDRQGKKGSASSIPSPPPLPPASPPSWPRPLRSPGAMSEDAFSPPTPTTPGAVSAPGDLERYGPTSAELIHEELRILFARPRIVFPRTPEVFIDQQSSPQDVQDWLECKGFNETIRQRLAGMAGATLLSLKKDALKTLMTGVASPKELWRLESQLKKNRSFVPFQTKSTAELKAALAKARQKAEADGVEGIAEEDEDAAKPQKPEKP